MAPIWRQGWIEDADGGASDGVPREALEIGADAKSSTAFRNSLM
jgi:hypothetical protein